MKKKTLKHWLKLREKIQQLQAEEAQIRASLHDEMVKARVNKLETVVDGQQLVFRKKENYTIPAVSVRKLANEISREQFNALFTTSYKLKPTTYHVLTGKVKNKINKVLTIREAPLSVSVKTIE